MEKIYVKPFLQQYRDAEHEGKIGMRAVVHYFELCASEFMYRNQKGQDTLPEKFGLAWMYTKYKIHLNKKFGFDTPRNRFISKLPYASKTEPVVNSVLYSDALKNIASALSLSNL